MEKKKCGCTKKPKSSIIPDTTPTSKRTISTDKAPLPVGPYSQAVVINNTVYVSGCLGLKPDTNKLIEGGAAVEAKLALKNMGAILEASGSSYNNVLKTTIFLENIQDFTQVNDVYKLFFSKDPPARSCIQVAKLPLGAKFEIEAIATLAGHAESVAPPSVGATSIQSSPAVDGGTPSIPAVAPSDVPPSEGPPSTDLPANVLSAELPVDAPSAEAPADVPSAGALVDVPLPDTTADAPTDDTPVDVQNDAPTEEPPVDEPPPAENPPA